VIASDNKETAIRAF